MADSFENKKSALGNIRNMLRDGQAKRLATLGAPKPEAPAEEAPPEAAPKAHVVEVHAVKLTPKDGPADEAAEGEPEEHPVQAGVMKLMDKILRPKKA